MLTHYTPESVLDLEKYYRRNLLNSISGYKSATLIGTKSEAGVSNLAVFSSVVHVGASPPLLGMVMRPLSVERQTYDYIKQRGGRYTINHVALDWVDKAHYTSAKFDSSTSEYEECKLDEEYLDNFDIPYVKDSHLKMGMLLVDEHHVKSNDTIFLVGAVQHLYVEDQAVLADGNIDLSVIDGVAISGLETYNQVSRHAHFSFARPGQWPSNNL